MSKNQKKLLTMIVPVYNEEMVLPLFYGRMVGVLQTLEDRYDLKVMFIDDGSRDSSWQMIQDISQKDERFCGVRLSRNFGHQAALSCGYELAPGNALVSIDSDLQDPPEVIPDLVREWEKGNQVVLAVRRKRIGETKFKLWTAKVYYRLMSKLSETDAPEGSGDFRLLDRLAVDTLKRFTETHRYIRGLVGWLGFQRGIVEYDRAPRQAGTTKYPLAKMVRLAMDGIVSLSFMPLRAAYIIAFVLMIPFLLYLGYALVLHYVFGIAMIPGWTSLILAVILFGSFNLIMLGILGEYTGRIYNEVKRRPVFLVQEFCGSNILEAFTEKPSGYPLLRGDILNDKTERT
jgi:polyisoprenyl-phosphate glycosyltransferase